MAFQHQVPLPSLMTKSPSQSSSSCSTSSGRSSPIRSHLTRIMTPITHGTIRFIIMDCPTPPTLSDYIRELLIRGVTDIVRVCDPTYDVGVVMANGIRVHDMGFRDGGVPSLDIIHRFLDLCVSRFGSLSTSSSSSSTESTQLGPCIAVHCVAGLGRAPVLVAVALIESGMTPLDAIEYIRSRRRGALNSMQLQYLVDQYKRSTVRRGTPFSTFLGSKRHGGKTNVLSTCNVSMIGMSDMKNRSSVSSHTVSSVPLLTTSQSSSSSSMSSSHASLNLRDSIARVFRVKRNVLGMRSMVNTTVTNGDVSVNVSEMNGE